MPQETVTFYNGNTYPILGLGTWNSKHHQVIQAVKDAIDIGYRHFDCALLYENEKEIGAAIAAKISEGVIKREDIFITSKLWGTYFRPERVEVCLRKSLENLGLQNLDLYLMHSPMAFQDGDILAPTDLEGRWIYDDVDYINTWRAMENLVEKGLVKNIGISNFNSEQVERLLANCKIKPVTNQVECHPYLTQRKLSDLCKSKDITITAYCPFASPNKPNRDPSYPQVIEDSKLKEIALKYQKTLAQIILRYQIQHGHLVIPKSVTKSRIQENFDIFDFKISPEDMSAIDNLDRNVRVCIMTQWVDHKNYPFKAEF